jgi:prevent-host-death family protein
MCAFSEITIMQTISCAEAGVRLAEILNQLEQEQQPLLISQRGQASAVLVPLTQYEQLTGADLGFAARLAQWRSNYAEVLFDAEPFV